MNISVYASYLSELVVDELKVASKVVQLHAVGGWGCGGQQPAYVGIIGQEPSWRIIVLIRVLQPTFQVFKAMRPHASTSCMTRCCNSHWN